MTSDGAAPQIPDASYLRRVPLLKEAAGLERDRLVIAPTTRHAVDDDLELRARGDAQWRGPLSSAC